jgi:catabolite regulation protein CreA
MLGGEVMAVWNLVLTVLITVVGFVAVEKIRKLDTVEKLINDTRVEVARDNVTNAEVDRITTHIDQRFNKLEAKIDQLIAQRT